MLKGKLPTRRRRGRCVECSRVVESAAVKLKLLAFDTFFKIRYIVEKILILSSFEQKNGKFAVRADSTFYATLPVGTVECTYFATKAQVF